MTKRIDKRLLELLVCLNDQAPLEHDESSEQLVCTKCGRKYAITDSGIPILLNAKK